jgi:hypothetical protein
MVKSYINNPHSFDMLATPVSYRLFNRRPHLKYSFFFLEFLRQGGGVCFDLSETSFGRLKGFRRLLSPLILFEILIWLYINRIPFSKAFLKVPKNSKLIIFTYKGATEKNFIKEYHLRRATHIFWHMSHYMISTSKKSKFINPYFSKSTLLADCDLSGNALFERYFSPYSGKILLTPFVPAERFKINSEPKQRKFSKVFATGTYHHLVLGVDDCDEAINTFNSTSHHYLRAEISSTKVDWIDDGQGCFGDQVGVLESGYFKRDLVEEFNKYAFIFCGDEYCGLPAISNFEAMCCGAMPIVNEKNYSGLGLTLGVHFLTHDGTLKGLESAFKLNNPAIFSNSMSERLKVRGLLMKLNIESISIILGCFDE